MWDRSLWDVGAQKRNYFCATWQTSSLASLEKWRDMHVPSDGIKNAYHMGINA